MARQVVAWMLGLALVMGVMLAGQPARAAETDAVLNKVPAGMPVLFVIGNAEELEKKLLAVAKSVTGEDQGDSPLAELKGELGVADWVDFSKPVAIAIAEIPPVDDSGLGWVVVPEFASKVKALEGATEEDGVWQLPVAPDVTVYAKSLGSYVVVGQRKALVQKAAEASKSMAESMQTPLAKVGPCDLLVHVDMKELRPQLQQQLAQFGAMAPMMAMGMAQGGDPMSMVNMLTAVLDELQRVVGQWSYVTAGLRVDASVMDLTLVTGFTEGDIRQMLNEIKPGEVAWLGDVPQQSYLLAMGSHFPSGTGKLLDHFFQTLKSKPWPAQDGEGDGPQAYFEKIRVLMGQVKGGSMVMNMNLMAGDMTQTATYLSDNPKALLDATVAMMTDDSPMAAQLNSGVSWTASGTKSVNGTEVQVFAAQIEPGNPAAMMLQGKIAGLGLTGDRVRMFQGAEAKLAEAFPGQIDAPLRTANQVKEALEALPRQKNMVMLLDIGSMMGAPGEPIGMSLSLAGDPAVLTIHVPVAALQRAMQMGNMMGGAMGGMGGPTE